MKVHRGFGWSVAKAVGVLVVLLATVFVGAGVAAAAAPTVLTLVPGVSPPQGGVTVTVTGEGFVDGATWVEVDGAYVPAEIQSPTTLTFVTPAMAPGTATVRVVVDEAPSAGLLLAYEAQEPVAPVVPPVASSAPTPRVTDDGRDRQQDPGPPAGLRPPPPTPVAALPPTLARTGSQTGRLAAYGGAMVLLGLALLGATDRPRRPGRVS